MTKIISFAPINMYELLCESVFYHLFGCEYHCLTHQVILFEISPSNGDIFQQLPELILYDVIVIVVTVDDVIGIVDDVI